MILVHIVTGRVSVVPLDDPGAAGAVEEVGRFETGAEAVVALAKKLPADDLKTVLAKLHRAFTKAHLGAPKPAA